MAEMAIFGLGLQSWGLAMDALGVLLVAGYVIGPRESGEGYLVITAEARGPRWLAKAGLVLLVVGFALQFVASL